MDAKNWREVCKAWLLFDNEKITILLRLERKSPQIKHLFVNPFQISLS